MYYDFNSFISKFNEIRKIGYVNSICGGSAGVGRTFEHLLGIKNNCLEFPDYGGIEIKTKASDRYGELSLFNCTPIGATEYEIARLKNKYGYPDREYKKYKVLSALANCIEKTKVGIFYKFQLKIDKTHRKLILLVFNLKDQLLDDSTFWPLDLIEARFMGKCSTLAFINAKKDYKYGKRMFFYDNLRIMTIKDFDKFINLLEKGIITVNFKIGIFKTPDNFGKIYDHGTAFKIDEKNLEMLFDVLYDSSKSSTLDFL